MKHFTASNGMIVKDFMVSSMNSACGYFVIAMDKDDKAGCIIAVWIDDNTKHMDLYPNHSFKIEDLKQPNDFRLAIDEYLLHIEHQDKALNDLVNTILEEVVIVDIDKEVKH